MSCLLPLLLLPLLFLLPPVFALLPLVIPFAQASAHTRRRLRLPVLPRERHAS